MTRTYWQRIGDHLVRVDARSLDNLAIKNRHLRLSAEHAKQRKGYPHPPEHCEGCDCARTLHGHHDDYAKPMDVIWLCAPCHMARHAELRVAAARAAGFVVIEIERASRRARAAR